MATIIKFPGHTWFRCRGDCEGCMHCCGGLASCITCGGAEASLTTHCPGERVPLLLGFVQDGSLDYKDGRWHFLHWDKEVKS